MTGNTIIHWAGDKQPVKETYWAWREGASCRIVGKGATEAKALKALERAERQLARQVRRSVWGL